MTTNMRNAIEQAAFEIGVATAKYEMLLHGAQAQVPGHIAVLDTPANRRKNAAFANAYTAQKEVKAPKIARGVKKAAGPRTPGVKKGILDLISSNAMSAADIIAKSGFNDNSVRATLMTLKKAGLAVNDDGLWIAAQDHVRLGGNSDTERAQANF